MSDIFDRVILPGIIQAEGGYTNNPSDAGGETNWGITVAVARANGYTGPMRDMPRSVAEAIYRAKYWIKPSFDKVAQVSERIAQELADSGVNFGPSVPSVWLQRWLTAFNRQGKDYPDLTADGAIGSKTVEALRSFIKVRGAKGERVLLVALNSSQAHRYLELAEGRGQNEDFLFGWVDNRVVTQLV